MEDCLNLQGSTFSNAHVRDSLNLQYSKVSKWPRGDSLNLQYSLSLEELQSQSRLKAVCDKKKLSIANGSQSFTLYHELQNGILVYEYILYRNCSELYVYFCKTIFCQFPRHQTK